MKILVKAKPNAQKEKVEQIGPSSPTLWGEKNEMHFSVSVKEPPRDSKANEAVARALARHFDIPRSRIRLISGFSSKEKKFEVDGLS